MSAGGLDGGFSATPPIDAGFASFEAASSVFTAASGTTANHSIGAPPPVHASTRRFSWRPPSAEFRYQPQTSLRIAHHNSVASTNSALIVTRPGAVVTSGCAHRYRRKPV